MRAKRQKPSDPSSATKCHLCCNIYVFTFCYWYSLEWWMENFTTILLLWITLWIACGNISYFQVRTAPYIHSLSHLFPYCAVIRRLVESFAKADFDKNTFFSYLPLPHGCVNVNSVSKTLLRKLRQHKWFYIAFHNSLRCMNWEVRSLEAEKALDTLTCT